MIVRTISQLPGIDSSPADSDLLEISKDLGDGYYKSCKISAGELETKFTEAARADIGKAFNMWDDSGNPIQISALAQTVNALEYKDTSLSGVKSFVDIPLISESAQYQSNPAQVPNVKEVKRLIDDRSLFIGPNYMVDADPGTDNVPSTTIYRDEFMYWHIDHLGTDSTQWKNPDFNNEKTEIYGVECQRTGYLNMFGWIADNGNVAPSDAWVGLFGQIQVRDSTNSEQGVKTKWILLQLSPWIIGQKSQERQYVSFNIPVKAGLRLKVKTGFAVNGNSAGAAGRSDVAFALNQPNSFVGYIMRAED